MHERDVRDINNPWRIDHSQSATKCSDVAAGILDPEIDAVFGPPRPALRARDADRKRRKACSGGSELALRPPEVVHDSDVWRDAARHVRVEPRSDRVHLAREWRRQERCQLSARHRTHDARCGERRATFAVTRQNLVPQVAVNADRQPVAC